MLENLPLLVHMLALVVEHLELEAEHELLEHLELEAVHKHHFLEHLELEAEHELMVQRFQLG